MTVDWQQAEAQQAFYRPCIVIARGAAGVAAQVLSLLASAWAGRAWGLRAPHMNKMALLAMAPFLQGWEGSTSPTGVEIRGLCSTETAGGSAACG